jgi:prevent-host-death family protein
VEYLPGFEGRPLLRRGVASGHEIRDVTPNREPTRSRTDRLPPATSFRSLRRYTRLIDQNSSSFNSATLRETKRFENSLASATVLLPVLISLPFRRHQPWGKERGIFRPRCRKHVASRLPPFAKCLNIEFDALSMRTLGPVMNISRDIHPLTDFKRNTSEFLARLKQTGDPLVLTINGKAELVVQDAKSYQRLLDIT